MSKHICLVLMTASTEWLLTDSPTNHFLVPVCQWFVLCIGGGCVGKMEPAIVQQSDMLVCIRQHGAYWHEALEPRIYPGDMNDFGAPCSHHLTNRIIYWRHGVFLWDLYYSEARETCSLWVWWSYQFCVYVWGKDKDSWQQTPNKIVFVFFAETKRL